MQQQPEKRGLGELPRFLSGGLQVATKAEVENFLTQPNARALVRASSYQDVFIVVKTVGLADSLELLPLTSKEQRCGFIDLDCWRKDSFHVRSFMEWLAAFMQCGPEETVRTARAVDPSVLAFLLKENIRVYALDPEEPPIDLPLTLTPDRRFGIEILTNGEGATMSRLLLDAVFRFDPSLGYDLVDRVLWENSVSLEEEAYLNKRRRLEEIGFVDYYEALDIYGETRGTFSPLTLHPRTEETEEKVASSKTLPALFVASLTPSDYLREALLSISEESEVDRIRHSMAALANRILSVHSVTPGDLEKVRPALEEMHDTLGLGLEYLTQGEEPKGSTVLRRYELQAIFQAGFQLLLDLRTWADRILSSGKIQLRESNELLLETPEAEFFSGLRRQRPLFFDGIEDAAKMSYRNFRTLRDISVSRNLLLRIQSMAENFWRLLPPPIPEVQLSDGTTNLSLGDIRFSQLFNTAQVNYIVGNGFQVTVLQADTLRQCFSMMSAHRRGGLKDWLYNSARSILEAAVGNSEDRDVMLGFAKKWVADMADEVTPLLLEKLEPRLIRTVLLRVQT